MSNGTVNERAKSDRTNPMEWLTYLVTAVSLVGIVLSLLGLGVAMAIQSVLGIPYRIVLGSPFDALELSATAVMQGLSNPEFIFDGAIYAEVWRGALPIIGLVIGGTLLTILLRALFSIRPKFSESQWLVRLLKKPESGNSSTGVRVQRAALYAVLWLSSVPVGTFVALAVMLFAGSILAVVPLVGQEAGRAYLHAYVISTEQCVPVLDRPARMARMEKERVMRERAEKRKTIPGATCVNIKQGDGETLSGRVAASTSTAIVLYDPVTGIARRVPIVDAIVESLGDLPLATSAASTGSS